MIHVALEEFLRTGVFGPLQFGMSRAQVESLVGMPEDWGGDPGHRRLGIWSYNWLELHFGLKSDDALWLIFSDHLLDLYGDSVIRLDPWIIREGTSRGEVLRHLQAVGIAYHQVTSWRGVSVITSGGVQLVQLGGNNIAV